MLCQWSCRGRGKPEFGVFYDAVEWTVEPQRAGDELALRVDAEIADALAAPACYVVDDESSPGA